MGVGANYMPIPLTVQAYKDKVWLHGLGSHAGGE